MTTTTNAQPEFDFEHRLPAGKEYFSVRYLARLWEVSERSVKRLVLEGSIKLASDIAPRTSKHSMWRMARVDVVSFLNDSANLAKMEQLRDTNRRKR
jgi:hypothetical protein